MKLGPLLLGWIVLASACDGGDGSAQDAGPAVIAPTPPARPVACRTRIESTSSQPPMGEVLGVSGGLEGVSVVTSSGVWQPGQWDARWAPAAPWVWGHDAYVFHDASGITALDPVTSRRRTVIPVPPHACDVTLARIPDAMVLLFRQPVRASADGCHAPGGTVRFVRWDDAGPTPTAPVDVLREEPVLGLQARWDAARLVVTVERSSGPETLVLDRRGTVLATLTGHTVACPIAGCISLLTGGEAGIPRSEPDRNDESPQLYARPLATREAFAIPFGATDVRALAVAGERIAIAARASDPNAPGEGSWLAGVYDMARRTLLTSTPPDGSAAEPTWTPGSPQDTVRVIASEGRFWWVAGSAPGPYQVFSTTCDP